jgi:hypothetical protein
LREYEKADCDTFDPFWVTRQALQNVIKDSVMISEKKALKQGRYEFGDGKLDLNISLSQDGKQTCSGRGKRLFIAV